MLLATLAGVSQLSGLQPIQSGLSSSSKSHILVEWCRIGGGGIDICACGHNGERMLLISVNCTRQYDVRNESYARGTRRRAHHGNMCYVDEHESERVMLALALEPGANEDMRLRNASPLYSLDGDGGRGIEDWR